MHSPTPGWRFMFATKLLHRSKPPPTVHYTKPMPDVDRLMQEWPPEVEEMLKETGIPTAGSFIYLRY